MTLIVQEYARNTTASALSIPQAVDGVALKRAVDSWVIASVGEKMAALCSAVL